MKSDETKTNLLTICIPTYNRKNELDFLLNEIFNQIRFNKLLDIQVAISDNSSNSETQNLVTSNYPKVIYNFNKVNIGAFGNLMKVTSMTSSEFVWVLGDDDFITPNAILNIYNLLLKISSNIDFIFLNACAYDSTLSYITNINESKNIKSRTYEKKSIDLFDDFSFNSLGHFSRLIFRQDKWLSDNPVNDRLSYEIYPQLKSILKLASQNNVYFFDKINLINSRRSTEASNSWNGFVAIYWAYEYLNLLELAVNKYGYPTKIKKLKYRNFKKIILAYLKINVQKEQYQKIIFKIKQQNGDFFYWFFMYPIELMFSNNKIRKIAKRIAEKKGITFYNINIDK